MHSSQAHYVSQLTDLGAQSPLVATSADAVSWVNTEATNARCVDMISG